MTIHLIRHSVYELSIHQLEYLFNMLTLFYIAYDIRTNNTKITNNSKKKKKKVQYTNTNLLLQKSQTLIFMGYGVGIDVFVSLSLPLSHTMRPINIRHTTQTIQVYLYGRILLAISVINCSVIVVSIVFMIL